MKKKSNKKPFTTFATIHSQQVRVNTNFELKCEMSQLIIM